MISSVKIAALAAAIFASGALTGGLLSARLGLGTPRPADVPALDATAPPGPSRSRSQAPGAQAPLQEPRRKDRTGARMPGAQRIEVLRHLEENLPMDPSQRDRIRSLVNQAEQRIQREWEPVMPRVRAEIRDLNRRIDAELRPDQRARLDELLGRRGHRRTNEPPASVR